MAFEAVVAAVASFASAASLGDETAAAAVVVVAAAAVAASFPFVDPLEHGAVAALKEQVQADIVAVVAFQPAETFEVDESFRTAVAVDVHDSAALLQHSPVDVKQSVPSPVLRQYWPSLPKPTSMIPPPFLEPKELKLQEPLFLY